MPGLIEKLRLNYVGGDFTGLQASAGINFTMGHVRGAQVSSGYNHARSVRGAQIGIVNYGGTVHGAQIGIVNIGGRVKGAQIGLVNVADSSSAPIGLVNVIRSGQQHLLLWGSDITAANLGLKLGGKHLYALFAAAIQPAKCHLRWKLGMGLGVHFPLPLRFYLDTDLLVWHVNDNEAWTHELNLLSQLRALAGFSIHKHFSIFAGVTANLAVSRHDNSADLSFIRSSWIGGAGRRTSFRLWPGFVVGLQI